MVCLLTKFYNPCGLLTAAEPFSAPRAQNCGFSPKSQNVKLREPCVWQCSKSYNLNIYIILRLIVYFTKYIYLVGDLKERKHFEELGEDGRVMLK